MNPIIGDLLPNKLPTRKPNRLKGYDYAQNGAYFVTICTRNRAELFGTIEQGDLSSRPQVKLTELGQCVNETLEINRPGNVHIDCHVIMPNHIHLIVMIHAQKQNPVQPSLSHMVKNIKSFVAKWAGFPVWQKSFHDHIIRDEQDYRRIAEYIDNNPARWEADCFHPANANRLATREAHPQFHR